MFLVNIKAHGSGIGEFDRIADQIDQNLLQALGIPDDRTWHIRGDINHRFDGLVIDRHRHDRPDIVDHIGQDKGFLIQNKFIGLDLRECQDFVNYPQQEFARKPDLANIFTLLLFKRGAFQKLRQSENRIHRGSDFVAHIGQEVILDPCQFFGVIARDFKFAVNGLQLLVIALCGQRTQVDRPKNADHADQQNYRCNGDAG